MFFDVVGIEYEYEKEGFELRSGRYLPDFWLPQIGVWFEVKGVDPNDTELRLAIDLWCETESDVWIASGAPSANDHRITIVGYGLLGAFGDGDYVYQDGYSLAADRKNEKSIWLVHDQFGGAGLHTKYSDGFSDKYPLPANHGLLGEAFNAARSARFEFGESGALNDNFTPTIRPSEKIISDETIKKMASRHADAQRKRTRYKLEWNDSPPTRTTT